MLSNPYALVISLFETSIWPWVTAGAVTLALWTTIVAVGVRVATLGDIKRWWATNYDEAVRRDIHVRDDEITRLKAQVEGLRERVSTLTGALRSITRAVDRVNEVTYGK